MNDILAKKKTIKEKPMMLLSTVNCSIGNKKKHFTLTWLKKLFYKEEALSTYDKYALKTIKNIEFIQEHYSEQIHALNSFIKECSRYY